MAMIFLAGKEHAYMLLLISLPCIATSFSPCFGFCFFISGTSFFFAFFSHAPRAHAHTREFIIHNINIITTPADGHGSGFPASNDNNYCGTRQQLLRDTTTTTAESDNNYCGKTHRVFSSKVGFFFRLFLKAIHESCFLYKNAIQIQFFRKKMKTFFQKWEHFRGRWRCFSKISGIFLEILLHFCIIKKYQLNEKNAVGFFVLCTSFFCTFGGAFVYFARRFFVLLVVFLFTRPQP
jgi:hypothetical protein